MSFAFLFAYSYIVTTAYKDYGLTRIKLRGQAGLGDIDKVRDILFGKYVADFQQRFSELESRLEADVEELKKRLSDKIDSMDDAVNQSLAGLDSKIAAEETSRDSELSFLQEMLNNAEKALEHHAKR